MSVEPSSAGPVVAVCIPTFRRPIGLRRCLDAVGALTGAEVTAGEIRVIVADNDGNEGEGLAVCRDLVAQGYRFSLLAISVPERGISQNRNALVREALRDLRVQFIAMVDDDERPHAEWLSALLDARSRFNADIVGGPVLRTFERPVAPHVAHANLPDFTKIPTGPIDLVDATSNILFRADLFREGRDPWFDLQYGLMGGEDVDILLGFKIAGRRFAWAHEAVVTEEMPLSRCSARWMLTRAYRIGNTDTLIRLHRRPPNFTIASEAGKILAASAVALVNLVVFAWHPARRFEGARLGARVVGKIVAFAGRRHQEYAVIHGR